MRYLGCLLGVLALSKQTSGRAWLHMCVVSMPGVAAEAAAVLLIKLNTPAHASVAGRDSDCGLQHSHVGGMCLNDMQGTYAVEHRLLACWSGLQLNNRDGA